MDRKGLMEPGRPPVPEDVGSKWAVVIQQQVQNVV